MADRFVYQSSRHTQQYGVCTSVDEHCNLYIYIHTHVYKIILYPVDSSPYFNTATGNRPNGAVFTPGYHLYKSILLYYVYVYTEAEFGFMLHRDNDYYDYSIASRFL